MGFKWHGGVPVTGGIGCEEIDVSSYDGLLAAVDVTVKGYTRLGRGVLVLRKSF